jgi:DNA excision repair protein ERCC-2
VVFPHAAARPGQREIQAAVERALTAREHLLLEAPTGLGKTAPVLTAALRFALAHDLRLVVLTSRTTQQRHALATLRQLAPPGIRVAAQLRSKAALCLTGEQRCHPDACRFARTHRSAIAEHDLVARALARSRAASRSRTACVPSALRTAPVPST